MQQILQEDGNVIIKSQQPAALRFFGHVISVVFHPLFIPIYVCCFILYWHPIVFAGYSPYDKLRSLASVFVNLTLLPAFTVFLLWRLKFISSIYLKTQKERIIPFAATMLFSFWCWNVFRNLPDYPEHFTNFLLGSFITIIVGWLANIYFKISMHGLAAGGMLAFVLGVAITGEGSSGQYIAAAILLTGLICTARLIVSDHKPFEVYAGLFVGAACQWLAFVL
jgi:hypothetical protein